MMKKARLLLTVWLMLLMAVMPSIALACASQCALNFSSNHKITPIDDCHTQATTDHSQSTQAKPDKSLSCSMGTLCHLTLGLTPDNANDARSITLTLSFNAPPAFMPTVTMSPPDKPPQA